MEDNSPRKLVSGRHGLLLAGFFSAGVIVTAIYSSFANTQNHNTGTARVQHQPQAIDASIDHGSAARDANTDLSTRQSSQDDDVDIALGGSWNSNDCTPVTVQVVKVPSGRMVEARDCQRSSPNPVHAYEAYEDEALDSLAYSDPIAALVLGRRLATTDPERTWDLMIRSSALLGGDVRPIKWLATNSFNIVKTNGEMATDTMQLRYVLDSLTRKLENTPSHSFDFREAYLRSSRGDAEVERLDRMVDALLSEMEVIETEATGGSTMRGEV